MTTQSLPSKTLSAEVTLESQTLRACLQDARPDVVATFAELTAAQQQQLVLDSWSIGVRALLNAHAQAQQAHLGDVGKTLVADLQNQLERQLEDQERAVRKALRRYFDPEDGQINERLRAFLDDDGMLAAKLRRFVGADNSVLAETLARQVGERSPLFKMLSPTDSQGLVKVLEGKVAEALEKHRTEVARALDPLQKDGAVGRFLTRLREQLDEADKDRGEQVARVVSALDSNDENSLLSRMVKESREAHVALRRAINPQLPDSPLATMKRTLEELLQERLGAQKERLEQLQVSQKEFQKELREAVARIETRREEAAHSTRGGGDFEADVLALVQRVVPAGLCTFEPTGHRVGRRQNCKIGDAVVRFAEESAFAGSGFVVEAKRDSSYTVPAALAELETACANRGTDIGLFVMACSHAPAGFPAFARYGSKLLVTWDPEDPTSDGILQGAIVAALALAQRKHSNADEGDINALAAVEQRLLKELNRFSRMGKSASQIQRHADTISDELRKSRKTLERVITDTRSTLKALHVETRDEEAETASPIEVDAVPFNTEGTEGSRDGAANSPDHELARKRAEPDEDHRSPLSGASAEFDWLEGLDDEVHAAEE